MNIELQTTESQVIYLTASKDGPKVYVHHCPDKVILNGITGPSAEGATIEDALYALAHEYRKLAEELYTIAANLEAFAPQTGEAKE